MFWIGLTVVLLSLAVVAFFIAPIEQLGPNVDIALIPSGEGLILDPSTLLAPESTDTE